MLNTFHHRYPYDVMTYSYIIQPTFLYSNSYLSNLITSNSPKLVEQTYQNLTIYLPNAKLQLQDNVIEIVNQRLTNAQSIRI